MEGYLQLAVDDFAATEVVGTSRIVMVSMGSVSRSDSTIMGKLNWVVPGESHNRWDVEDDSLHFV